MVKNLPANAGELSSIPGLGRSLEKEMTTHSSLLAWKNPMDRGAWGGYSPQSHKESDTTEHTHAVQHPNL